MNNNINDSITNTPNKLENKQGQVQPQVAQQVVEVQAPPVQIVSTMQNTIVQPTETEVPLSNTSLPNQSTKKPFLSKKNIIILMVIVSILIVGALVLYFVFNKSGNNKTVYNPYELTDIYKVSNYTEGTIYSNNSKVTFMYPDTLHLYEKSYSNLFLRNDFDYSSYTIGITANILSSTNEEDIYNNIKSNNDSLTNVEYGTYDEIKCDNIYYSDDYSYMNCFSKDESNDTKKIVNNWYILIKLSNENLLEYIITADSIIPYEVINNLIKITKTNDTTNKQFTISGNTQKGVLSINTYGEYNKGYNASIELDNTFKEEESDASYAFFSKSVDNKTLVLRYGLSSLLNQTFEETYTNTYNNLENLYGNNPSNTNLNISSISNLTNGEYEYVYYTVTYDDHSGTEENYYTFYDTSLFLKISDSEYLNIELTSYGEEITESMLKELLNIKIDKY